MPLNPTIANLLDRHRIQVVPPLPPLASDEDQLSIHEDVQVTHHRGPTELRKGCDELASRVRAVGDEVEHFSSSRFREGFPDKVY